MNGNLVVRFKEGGERIFSSDEWVSYSINQTNGTVKVVLPDNKVEHFSLLNLLTIEIDY